MADIHSNVPEKLSPRGGASLTLMRLIQFGFLTFFWLASIALVGLFLLNLRQIYGFEVVAVRTIIAGIYPSAGVTATAVLASIPWIVVCVIATIITIGAIVFMIWGDDPIGWLDREIERLKRQCPLSRPGQPNLNDWLHCRSVLSALRTVYWGVALSMLVTTINILAIISPLIGPLPLAPVPPPF